MNRRTVFYYSWDATREIDAPLEVIENRFPTLFELRRILGILRGVQSFNLHPHLPHLEPLAEAAAKLDVLARQRISAVAPPHPFTADGRTTFSALLQSRPGVFPGTLLVGDATLWSSNAGGLDSLRRLWTNVLQRP